MPRKRDWMTRSLFAAAIALSAMPGAARAAADVGVAAAVNPDAFSRMGEVTNQIVIGKTILYNERIATSQKGLVQVLFIDGSTITVGPGSDLVIDKFVYDPAKGKGELAATFGKGMLRFVGGKLSKQAGAVKFNTPVGTLGIRGGMFQSRVGDGQGSFSFLFGDEMTFTGGNGQTSRVFEANNTLQIGGPGGSGPSIRPTRPEDAQFFVANLSGQGGPGGGASGPSDQQVQSSGIGGANSGNGNQGGLPQFPNNITDNTNLTDRTTSDVIRDLAQNQSENQGGDVPTTVKARVLLPGGAFLAFVGTANEVLIDDPGSSGILGGDPNMDVDDFVTTASLVDGRFTGTVTGLIDHVDDICGEGGCQPVYGPIEPHTYSFPFSTQPGVHEFDETSGLTVVSPSETIQYAGSLFVAPDGGFFAYRLFELIPYEEGFGIDLDNQLLMFGGTPYVPETNAGAGKLREFAISTDPRENTLFPFASAASSPEFLVYDEQTDQYFVDPNATVSRLFLLEQDTGRPGQAVEGDASRSVWLQASFHMTGEGADQESILVIGAGLAVDQSGNTALVGERRGSSRVLVADDWYETQGQQTANFSGGISTLAGADGNHLFGNTAPSFVIGADSTGATGNILTDEPIDLQGWQPDELSGATYHIGTQANVGAAPTQTTRTLQGYAAGMMQTRDPLYFPPNALATGADSETGQLDFVIHLNAEANTLDAKAVLNDVQGTDPLVKDYSLLFGTDSQGNGISAYIDDERFAAFETPGASSVTPDYGPQFSHTKAQTYIVSGGLLSKQQIFGSDHAFCSQCDFIKWGAWGGKVGFGNQSDTDTSDFFHLGWWVAGDLTTNGQLDDLQAANMSATYSGQAIGNVANRVSGNDWQNYTAHGDLQMNWNFGSRTGDLTISNFDQAGYTFTAQQLTSPGAVNQFNGALSGSGMQGSASGSFVNNGAEAAAGVIGNWNAGSNDYKAVGVFAGKGTPAPNQ